MTQISDVAQASREAHRAPDGRFGVQPATEATAVTLGEPPIDDTTAMRELQDTLNRIARDLGTADDWSPDQIDQLAAALRDYDTATVDRERFAGTQVDPDSRLGSTRDLLVGVGFSGDAVTVHDDHVTIQPANGFHGLAIEVFADEGHSGQTWYTAERVSWSMDRDGQSEDTRTTICYGTDDVALMMSKVSEEAASLDDDGHGGSAWPVFQDDIHAGPTPDPDPWGIHRAPAGDQQYDPPPF
ncbi:hypothetical protein GCM10009584_20620 [Ornithinimicrobium humiphilum]|uniref:Uncharacterized protein n=1 Tax=Ornithinimicrobium humiphilum TaxID=125288 RepID=A0A543KNI9_9MICO|nr:hypothetical protein [Ornithinimicrobium humiphilum]TQM96638.1 hypothetical protein FB476_1515 [Ornithinimicrobium humiphilum]